MPNTSQKPRGYTAAITSALVLSTTSIVIRHLTQTYALPALVLAFWRDLIVALCVLAGLSLIRPALLPLNRQNLRYMFWYGLVLALFNSLWTLSVALNGAAIATVLAYSSVAFTALLGTWVLKERLNRAKGLAVLLSLAGCVLVSGATDPGGWQANLTGILTGILSGLLYAMYTMMGRSASLRGINPWTTLLYTFGFATVFLLAFNLLSGGMLPGAARNPSDLLWLGKAWAGWGVLFLLGAGPTVVGFGLYNISLTHLPSSVVNLIATTEPAFTAAIAYIFLGERLTWIQIAGSLLILGAVVLLRMWEGRKIETSVVEVPPL